MDIKGMIDEVVSKIKSDKNIAEKFKNDPIKTVESILGIDLPDDQLKGIVDGIKASIAGDKAGDVFGSIKKLF